MLIHGRMVELVDTLDLKSGALRHVGSSPTSATIICGSNSVVESHVANVVVAGSNPVSRSITGIFQRVHSSIGRAPDF